jgi:hypothetical protein
MDFWPPEVSPPRSAFSDLAEAGLRRVETSQQEILAERRKDQDARDAAREWLDAALVRLSPDDRAVITLVELEERSMEDAAPPGGLRSVRCQGPRLPGAPSPQADSRRNPPGKEG